MEWCNICDEEEVTDMTQLRVCNNCYNALYYWKKKSVKDTIQRQHNLEKYQRRMDYINGTKGGNE